MRKSTIFFVVATIMLLTVFIAGVIASTDMEKSSTVPAITTSSFMVYPGAINRSSFSFVLIRNDDNTIPVDVRLRNLKGDDLYEETVSVSEATSEIEVPINLDEDNLHRYTLSVNGHRPIGRQSMSLYHLFGPLNTVVRAQSEYIAGSTGNLRVISTIAGIQTPVPDALVNIALAEDEEKINLFEGRTDEFGTINAEFTLPQDKSGDFNLLVSVQKDDKIDEVIQPVSVLRTTKIMLVSDKPIYQPGQVMHMRALCLNPANMNPISSAEAKIEVMDSNGNKVFKEMGTTTEYGVLSADFQLASLVNLGSYTIRATVGNDETEKTVNVSRYVLPKFSVSIDTDRSYYRPGQDVRGSVSADYFFGRPVAGAEVELTFSSFQGAYAVFHSDEITLDENGQADFEVTLPDYFVGTEYEQGLSHFMIEAEVTDNADHMEQGSLTKTVSENPMIIAMVPENRTIIRDVPNKIMLVCTDPSGAPIETELEISTRGTQEREKINIQTDSGGFAEFEITPTRNNVDVTVSALDYDNYILEENLAGISGDGDSLLLRVSSSMLSEGDTLNVDIYSSRQVGVAYLDIIKNRQTVHTETIPLEEGHGSLPVDIDSELVGTIELNAYLMTREGYTLSQQRLVIVEPARDLNIEVVWDREEYLPGEDASMDVQVRDSQGNPQQACLGIMIVDQAVFALSEIHPGLEKVYFYLEQELATPRIEVHGWDLPVVMLNPEEQNNNRKKAADMLLSSVEIDNSSYYSIDMNTYVDQGKNQEFKELITEEIEDQLEHLGEAFGDYYYQYWEMAINVEELVDYDEDNLRYIYDPWGRKFRFDHGRYEYSPIIVSAGPDGDFDTVDDIVWDDFGEEIMVEIWDAWDEDVLWEQDMMMADGFGGGAPGNAAVRQAAPMNGEMNRIMSSTEEAPAPMGTDDSGGGGGQEPRVRSYFPETLFFEPGIITDNRGRARLTIPLADSITTWQGTLMASTLDGLLGSTETSVRVFKDFFIDIDFPVQLTQNDEISVPVAVYNYLSEERTVQLVAEESDWFEFLGESELEITVPAESVRSARFMIRATGVGNKSMVVRGYAGNESDGVSRVVEIIPDGTRQSQLINGRLTEDIEFTFDIPDNAIEDASNMVVKIYPGVFSQVVEGMEGLLSYPSGCFEQTSSSTYPNIMVLSYLRETEQATPEVEMQAEGMINTGYQRLLSYEVNGGGFSWFGDAPAHNVLTVYGLMEFYDMSKVIEIDENIVPRTQRFLAAQQQADGSWQPSGGGIQEGAINEFEGNVLRTTGYMLWGLGYTGYEGNEINRAINYVGSRINDMDDAFTLAICSNAIVSADPRSNQSDRIIEKLADEVEYDEDNELAWVPYTGQTPTYGGGDVAVIEVTALAAYAFLKHGSHQQEIQMMINWLVAQKDNLGTWTSTQATIQSLRAFLESVKSGSFPAEGVAKININGTDLASVDITYEDSDVLRMIELQDYIHDGSNDLEISFQGEGNLFYQVEGWYYEPREEMPEHAELFSFDVNYDQTSLKTDDILGVEVVVLNNADFNANMILIDLGIPPGFSLDPTNLEDLVDRDVIARYETTPRQIIIYLEQLRSARPVTINYDLIARYPLRAQAPASSMYEYYNPNNRAEVQPVMLSVTED